MGREVRRVPANWQHPKNERGDFVPLHDGKMFESRVREWDEGAAKWAEGLRDDYKGGWKPIGDDIESKTYAEWSGDRPEAADYMPVWSPEEATHLMMYEDTSEGTPISPAFATPEELARWLADNKVSAFGIDTATYEQWLAVCKGAWAPSMVYVPESGLVSGVSVAGEQ